MSQWDQFEPAFSVVRVTMDRLPTATTETVDAIIKVVRVVWSIDEAETEVERLNSLNEERCCLYFVQHTKVRVR